MITRLLLFLLLGLSIPVFAQKKLLAGRAGGYFPFLEYGLGEDRLGGAKMTYLDNGVVLFVEDSVKDRYKVRLSANHAAWLPKENFIADSLLYKAPYYLTGSWKVHGDEQYDYVRIRLDQKLPYRSRQEIDPSRIIVDIFGPASNTNWVTQLLSVKEIKNVYHEQVEDDVFRVIIDLQHAQHWGYAIYYEDEQLVIRIKRQPPVLKLKKMKIVVDAGHGGTNTGAIGIATSIQEKEYTLKIAKALQAELVKAGAEVYMTRSEDVDRSMNQRMDSAQRQNPDLLISIHLNSSSKKTIRGTSTYYRYIGFRNLSQAVLKRMLQLPLENFGNIGSFNFTLNGPTAFPNCLVEVAFLSNAEDEQLIRDPVFHQQVARKITAGIKDWLREID